MHRTVCLALASWLVWLTAGSGRAAERAVQNTAGQQKPQAVMALDLTGCPEGPALEFPQVRKDRRRFGPPCPAVDKFLAGWTPGLSGWKGVSSCMKVAKENGATVLICSPPKHMPGRTLVTGHPTWRDLEIEASVRLIRQTLIPLREAYGEHTSVPHVGVFARSLDSIRHYVLALEPGRVSLYLKGWDEWIPLRRKTTEVKPDTWYTLRLSVSGDRLTGYLDGQAVVSARDTTCSAGKAGLRFNAESRVRRVTVRMTGAQKAQADAAKAAYQAEEAAARATYPKPVVLKKLKLPGGIIYPAHLRSADTWDLVVVGRKTWGVDLDGKVLWEYPAQLINVAPGKPDAAGVSRVVGVKAHKTLVMLDGRTGAVMHEVPGLPKMYYSCWRLGNLTGKGEVNYVVRSGDTAREFNVYDEHLQVLFKGRPAIDIGHTHGVAFWDVDGDGVEELQAGGSCLRGDGTHVWDCRVTESHLDQIVLGPLGPRGEPTSVFLGVDEGVTFVDGLSGERISCVPNGHPQGAVAGDFRPDIPGIEVLTISRWASYGVTGLFTGDGRILRQWMLAGEELPGHSLPVTWGDDGGDLAMVSLLSRPPTLYDGYGHQIFQLPEPSGYRLFMTLLPLDITGDGRDEIFSVRGTTLTIYTQDRPAPPGAPKRASTVKWMNMSLPAWTFRRGTDIIPNGGFEQVGPDGKPVGWKLHGGASVVAEPGKVFAGSRAIKVTFDNSAWATFPIKPETVYATTGMVRHDVPTAVDPGRLKILFDSADGTLVGGVAARLFNLNANAYRGFYYTFRTPAGAVTCRFGVCGRFTGKDYMLYDAVTVRELPVPPRRP